MKTIKVNLDNSGTLTLDVREILYNLEEDEKATLLERKPNLVALVQRWKEQDMKLTVRSVHSDKKEDKGDTRSAYLF